MHFTGITTDNDYSGLAAQYIVSECHDPMELTYLPHDRHVLTLYISLPQAKTVVDAVHRMAQVIVRSEYCSLLVACTACHASALQRRALQHCCSAFDTLHCTYYHLIHKVYMHVACVYPVQVYTTNDTERQCARQEAAGQW
jgi:hypothetical protein